MVLVCVSYRTMYVRVLNKQGSVLTSPSLRHAAADVATSIKYHVIYCYIL